MKKLFIFLVSRIIKLFANLTKLACYVFHFLFPNKRFTLPGRAPPLYAGAGQSVIPKVLWQTNYTDRVTLAVYLNYLFNRLMSPTFEYRFMITEERARFVEANYPPEVHESYSSLQIGAAQADFWRLLVLHKCGGVYLDIDAHVVWPLSSIIRPECTELYLTTKSGEITNYFIASRKDNPHLQQMINIILDNIKENRIKNIFDLTGPGVLNQVLDADSVNTANYRYTCNQGNFTNEFFQYIDKPQGKWTKVQGGMDVIKK